METSNALDLEENIFESTDSARIAASLKQSSEKVNEEKPRHFKNPEYHYIDYEDTAEGIIHL